MIGGLKLITRRDHANFGDGSRSLFLYAACKDGTRVTGSAILGGSGHGSVCQTPCMTRFYGLNMRVYRGVVSTE